MKYTTCDNCDEPINANESFYVENPSTDEQFGPLCEQCHDEMVKDGYYSIY